MNNTIMNNNNQIGAMCQMKEFKININGQDQIPPTAGSFLCNFDNNNYPSVDSNVYITTMSHNKNSIYSSKKPGINTVMQRIEDYYLIRSKQFQNLQNLNGFQNCVNNIQQNQNRNVSNFDRNFMQNQNNTQLVPPQWTQEGIQNTVTNNGMNMNNNNNNIFANNNQQNNNNNIFQSQNNNNGNIFSQNNNNMNNNNNIFRNQSNNNNIFANNNNTSNNNIFANGNNNNNGGNIFNNNNNNNNNNQNNIFNNNNNMNQGNNIFNNNNNGGNIFNNNTSMNNQGGIFNNNMNNNNNIFSNNNNNNMNNIFNNNNQNNNNMNNIFNNGGYNNNMNQQGNIFSNNMLNPQNLNLNNPQVQNVLLATNLIDMISRTVQSNNFGNFNSNSNYNYNNNLSNLLFGNSMNQNLYNSGGNNNNYNYNQFSDNYDSQQFKNEDSQKPSQLFAKEDNYQKNYNQKLDGLKNTEINQNSLIKEMQARQNINSLYNLKNNQNLISRSRNNDIQSRYLHNLNTKTQADRQKLLLPQNNKHQITQKSMKFTQQSQSRYLSNLLNQTSQIKGNQVVITNSQSQVISNNRNIMQQSYQNIYSPNSFINNNQSVKNRVQQQKLNNFQKHLLEKNILRQNNNQNLQTPNNQKSFKNQNIDINNQEFNVINNQSASKSSNGNLNNGLEKSNYDLNINNISDKKNQIQANDTEKNNINSYNDNENNFNKNNHPKNPLSNLLNKVFSPKNQFGQNQAQIKFADIQITYFYDGQQQNQEHLILEDLQFQQYENSQEICTKLIKILFEDQQIPEGLQNYIKNCYFQIDSEQKIDILKNQQTLKSIIESCEKNILYYDYENKIFEVKDKTKLQVIFSAAPTLLDPQKQIETVPPLKELIFKDFQDLQKIRNFEIIYQGKYRIIFPGETDITFYNLDNSKIDMNNIIIYPESDENDQNFPKEGEKLNKEALIYYPLQEIIDNFGDVSQYNIYDPNSPYNGYNKENLQLLINYIDGLCDEMNNLQISKDYKYISFTAKTVQTVEINEEDEDDQQSESEDESQEEEEKINSQNN
ncbi:Peptidase S59, nucleoporin [Pseudocohnilembus persalinus]|uniref:Peptidase S59, nucleoporin n=1 Tax=Pseudocohnilembus persalinus TaxID=266149 RepID=A0A0V0QZE2_PSEPJ|nr:Peptidase S59, nucleoporin [Pseudocohnilembus persalinus]|eukprot:KRX07604.1 Peptidase S59, nucleoporin [Pseudocohnilembus persalinus]